MDKTKEKWKAMLRLCLMEYRQKCHDPRNDREILEDFMEYLVKTKFIKKSKSGKFLLPDLIDDA